MAASDNNPRPAAGHQHPVEDPYGALNPENTRAGAELKLGEFQFNEAFSTSAVNIFLERLHDKRAKEASETRHEHSELPACVQYQHNENVKKIAEYVQDRSVFQSGDTIMELETMMRSYGPALVQYEKAQLETLMPQEADEAMILIPSLKGKIGEEELQGLLDEMTKIVHREQVDKMGKS